MIVYSINMLLLIALALAFTHFAVPLAYYHYLKTKWLNKPWNVRRDPSYKPKVSIIVPTYNEAGLIESKLDDLARQGYPRELVEIIVVDSASTDGTSEKVVEWARRNPGVKLALIREPERRGKAHALNHALKHISGDVVIITDVDAMWSSSTTLSSAISWFSDPTVGAVTCLKLPAGKGLMSVEEGYREFYNVVRLAESKKHSTPVFHGELAAFRRALLESVGGFPTNIGADDSHIATRITLMGYRAIAVDNTWCIESVPRKGYHTWRIRRAQHLIQHFMAILKRLWRTPRELHEILLVETYLHLLNQWILVAAAAILLYLALNPSIVASALIVLGATLLAFKPYRTWVMTQLYLVIALIRNLWTREIAWEKQAKTK